MFSERDHQAALKIREAMEPVAMVWEWDETESRPLIKYATATSIVMELKKLGYVLVEEKEFKDEYYEAWQDGYSVGHHEGLNEPLDDIY